MIRLVLAATLGASYGIYGPPFEQCVGTPVRPGSEEYLDSEKYQITHWDLDVPWSLRDYIARINEIRRENPALHYNRNLRFFDVDNEAIICYGKSTPDMTNLILVIVNLDPYSHAVGLGAAPRARAQPGLRAGRIVPGARPDQRRAVPLARRRRTSSSSTPRSAPLTSSGSGGRSGPSKTSTTSCDARHRAAGEPRVGRGVRRALESETGGDYASVAGTAVSGTGERTIRPAMIILSDFDLQLIGEGTHDRLYEKLGAHVLDLNGSSGTHFARLGPARPRGLRRRRLQRLEPAVNPLSRRGMTGVWSGFVPAIRPGDAVQISRSSPPTAARGSTGPTPTPSPPSCPPGPPRRSRTSSGYEWGDGRLDGPPRRPPIDHGADHDLRGPSRLLDACSRGGQPAPDLPRDRPAGSPTTPHEMGFTHVELMPVSEHPSPQSPGATRSSAYYAASGRFGTPHDLMFLVDTLHRRGIGVILDWVPAHFAPDPHGLAEFDGTHLYEHADPQQAAHPGLGTHTPSTTRAPRPSTS